VKLTSLGWILLPLSTRSRALPIISQLPLGGDTGSNGPRKSPRKEAKRERGKFASSVLEGSTVALISLLGLGLGGYAYSLFYKRTVRNKIENAFATGYSSQERVALGRIAYGVEPDQMREIVEKEYWVPRDEQEVVNDIVNG
jgi:hypothetical protein